MKGNRTLIVLSPAFPENEAATYWVPSQQLMVKALKRNFPELNIIVLATLYPYKISEYEWYDIPVSSFNGTHRRKLKRIGLWKDISGKLKSIYSTKSVIGILSFWCGEFAFIANLFAKRYSLPHYIWICGQDARKLNRWVKFIRPGEDQLMAMSGSLVNEFYKSHGIKPKYIVPNAIDPSTFPEQHSTQRDIDILGAGSFEPLKRYDLFTSIVKSIQETIPGINVFHCGIGREREKTEALIEKFSLQNSFRLLGGKKQEEILALMQRTKIFLHTSSYEGFSTVCLEALYAGAHVISFCYPLSYQVPHWHVVTTAEEMTTKVLEILRCRQPDHSSILLFRMDESAKMIMSLFDQNRPQSEKISIKEPMPY